MRTVAVTTIREGDSDSAVERVRAEIFLDTAKELAVHGIDCIAVHTDCSESYLDRARSVGTRLIPETRSGMGHSRRQAIRAGFESGADYCFWLEPEKSDMPRFLNRMISHMRKKRASLGLFTRKDLRSYPREQALYYAFCRSVASRLLGSAIDYGFGPMVIARNAMPYFLDYNGDYGDTWDSILIPRLRILQGGGVATLSIAFRNDARLTAVEDGRDDMILKRVTQLGSVIPALIEEWRRLATEN